MSKPEVRGFEIVGTHDNHRHDHYHLDRNIQSANGLADHWQQRGCKTSVHPLIRLTDLEAARAADKARIAELTEALTECAASLAWNCFGECRAVHDGPIMPAAGALGMARKALSQQGKEGEA